MPLEQALEAARTAVLSLDMQAGIVSIYVEDQEAMMSRAADLLRRCRERGMTIIHVQVGFRAGLPEISARNELFAAIRDSPEHQQLFQGDAGRIHPAVAPVGDDIVIVKSRISAFTGTDLDMILRAKEITTLVMFGIATSGVVLSTLLHAVDADYRVVVIKDCCADREPAVQTTLLNDFFPRRGAVVTAAEVVQSLG